LSLLDACAKEFGHVNVGSDGDYSQASRSAGLSSRSDQEGAGERLL
jgi:hypothetical protein